MTATILTFFFSRFERYFISSIFALLSSGLAFRLILQVLLIWLYNDFKLATLSVHELIRNKHYLKIIYHFIITKNRKVYKGVNI